jgi:hypothetical protein
MRPPALPVKTYQKQKRATGRERGAFFKSRPNSNLIYDYFRTQAAAHGELEIYD